MKYETNKKCSRCGSTNVCVSSSWETRRDFIDGFKVSEDRIYLRKVLECYDCMSIDDGWKGTRPTRVITHTTFKKLVD